MDEDNQQELADFDEDRSLFHRLADPFDLSTSLPIDSDKQDVQNWCKSVLKGKFASQFLLLSDGLNGEELHKLSPLDLEEKATKNEKIENPDVGIALYFYVHLWECNVKHAIEELVKKATDNIDNIYSFTSDEIHLLLSGKTQLSEEVRSLCRNYWSQLIAFQNRFVDWQMENQINPIVLVS